MLMSSAVESIPPICLGCNYPLSQLDSATRICPECGRQFDPADPWTMNTTRPVPDFLRRWIGPIGWSLPAMRIVAVLVLLANIPLAGCIETSLLALCISFLAIGVPYFVRCLIRRAAVVRYCLPLNLLTPERKQLNQARRLFALAALLLFFRIPFYVVFVVSLPWLNASGHREYAVRPVFAERPHHTVIGLFPIRKIEVTYQGAFFDTWLGVMRYTESDDGNVSWQFLQGDYPFEDLLERIADHFMAPF